MHKGATSFWPGFCFMSGLMSLSLLYIRGKLQGKSIGWRYPAKKKPSNSDTQFLLAATSFVLIAPVK